MALPNASTDICNIALAMLGEKSITSLSDNTKAARLCSTFYDSILDEMLTARPWSFATRRLQLAENVTSPDFDWDYSYAMPSDALRVTKVTDEDSYAPEEKGADFEVSGRDILTNLEDAWCVYTKRETDVSKFPIRFVWAFAARLAMDLADSLSKNTKQWDIASARYQMHMREAMLYDSRADNRPVKTNRSFLDARS